MTAAIVGAVLIQVALIILWVIGTVFARFASRQVTHGERIWAGVCVCILLFVIYAACWLAGQVFMRWWLS